MEGGGLSLILSNLTRGERGLDKYHAVFSPQETAQDYEKIWYNLHQNKAKFYTINKSEIKVSQWLYFFKTINSAVKSVDKCTYTKNMHFEKSHGRLEGEEGGLT